MDYYFKELKKEEVYQLVEIDRSDYSENTYQLLNGQLIIQPSIFNHPGISKKNYKPYIDEVHNILDNGGMVCGAFCEEKLVGICSIDSKPVGKYKNMLNLGLLWVSKEARRTGIASKLIDICKEYVLKSGFSSIYISATPSKNTIDFYLRIGSIILKDIDPELYAMEPEDIHLELRCK